jgi:hypothetical protein
MWSIAKKLKLILTLTSSMDLLEIMDKNYLRQKLNHTIGICVESLKLVKIERLENQCIRTLKNISYKVASILEKKLTLT